MVLYIKMEFKNIEFYKVIIDYLAKVDEHPKDIICKLPRTRIDEKFSFLKREADKK
jgi:hypothetical protein